MIFFFVGKGGEVRYSSIFLGFVVVCCSSKVLDLGDVVVVVGNVLD